MIPNWRQLEHILGSLMECYREAPPFVVHYGWRDGAAGRHGIHDLSLIQAAAESLQRAWELLKQHRPALLAGLPQEIHVYVFDTPYAALVDVAGQEGCVILLPVRHRVARWDDVLERAQAEAAHEVMHLFNAVKRSPASLASRAWQWLDEGLAICAEGWVWPDNADHQRFLLDWRDYPETPLDLERARYQTQMLTHYLAQRFGKAWLFDLWDRAAEDTPIAAIKNRLPDGLAWEEVFTDYLGEAYSLSETDELMFAPALGDRLGARLLTANVALPRDDAWRERFTLDHLAGRYFRFTWPSGARQIQVRLQEDASGTACLRAVLWQTGATRVRLAPDGKGSLTACLPLSNDPAQEAIVAVANAGELAQRPRMDVPHHDDRSFWLEVSAT